MDVKPWFENTKFRQGKQPFQVLARKHAYGLIGGGVSNSLRVNTSAADIGTFMDEGRLFFYPKGTGKNLTYDGVNTDYWVVQGELKDGKGKSQEGYHAIRFDKDGLTLNGPYITGDKKRQYEAQEEAAMAFYDPKVSAALAEANGSSGEKELKNWWSDYVQQEEKYEAVEKKGAYHFMNLTSGIQMKILKQYSDLYGSDSLQDVLYSLYKQDGTVLFSYGAYVGPEIGLSRDERIEKGTADAYSKKTMAMIKAVQEADISLPSPDANAELFYDVAYVNYDKKSKKVGPEMTWTAKINTIDAFGGKEMMELSSDTFRYIPKNTRDNPVKFNPKTTFQFSRTYLIDVGTKKKQRVTYKSRKAGDGLVIWKKKDVAKKAASVARSKGYLMRTVPVADGWVNLAAKRKSYPDWHPLYSEHNKNLMASGKLPKNLRDYHRR